MNNIFSSISTPSSFRNGMGQEADWSSWNLEDTIRRQVILRHVWILNRQEIPWITNIFLKKATAADIVDFINEDHEFKDRLEFSKKLWDIEYIDLARSTLTDLIESESDEEFLLSFRENTKENFLVVIIKRLRVGTTPKPYIRSIAP